VSNWPLLAASRYETLGAGTGLGTTVTTGALNTKGSYASIGTTTFRYSGFLLQLVSNNGTRFRFDVAVNTGGSDQVIVEDFYYDSHFSSTVSTISLWFPVSVPSGAAIKIKAQAAAATQSFLAIVQGYATDFPGHTSFRACRSATDFTNTDPTNSVTQTGNTVTSWAQVVSSTVAAFAGLYVSPAVCADTSRTSSKMLVDIAVGAGGSEQVVISALQFTQNASGPVPSGVGPVLCDIPAGTRLSSRVQCSAAGAADAFNVSINGLVA
jgi:hypothetical protein